MKCSLDFLLNATGLDAPIAFENVPVKSISCDSRSVHKGGLFFGLPGEQVDGGCFWRQAISHGAVAAIISKAAASVDPPNSEDMVFVVPDPVTYWMGEMAAVFWDKPSLKMDLIGVTGTNGKTTVTYLIEHLSSRCGLSCALFGTLVNRWPGHTEIANHTTAFGDVLQSKLSEAVISGTRLGAMEVSSHALAQSRVAGCNFSGAIFTNLTQDHLDYHHSMEAYFESKSLLFQSPLLKKGNSRVVVNVDDPWGYRLSKDLKEICWRASLKKDVIESINPELFISNIKMSLNGVEGVLHSPMGNGRFQTSLIGRFNLMNLLEAIGALLQRGIPLETLLPSLRDFSGVPGRMEQIALEGCLPKVIVDYAHTPDGLENVLKTLRSFVSGNLYCVFGCGGDRDRGKRAKMGHIAQKYADNIILTSDNPRTENPRQILDDIMDGITTQDALTIEGDRAIAIHEAISLASPGDIVLIAGKGHEDYQILGEETIKFDDREIARKALLLKLNS